MSQPLPIPDPINRANWLGRYLAVERQFDDNLKVVLADSLSGVDEAFGKLGDKFSDQVRRAQLTQSNRALRGVISSLFGDTSNLIRNYRQDAAMAAIDAGLYDQRSILARIFPDSVSRNAYANSLRQSGRRNIESVITRVLETEKPLSARVYKSRALANGLVSRAINRALARGDSAANLARDVRNLIDPNVPGGVSYAAKRLGRTEINNAFHAQSIHDAQDAPWIQQMEWHLSKRHLLDPGDECEVYAHLRLFDIGHVPEKPHPNCRCYVTPELPEYQDFENALISGQYDQYLDEVLAQGKASGSGTETLEAVKWDGPPVAKPIKDTFIKKMSDPDLIPTNLDIANSAVIEDIDQIWTSIDFDQFKGPIREGARIAQRDGYSGMPRKLRSEISMLQEDTSSFSGPDPGDRTDRILNFYGKEIVARGVHDPSIKESVWRGVQYPQDIADKIIEGQRVSLPLSSFSDNIDFARDHALGESNWISDDFPGNGKPIVFELLSGAKPANMGSGEFAAFGQFDVVSVKEDFELGIKHVRLHQVSMREADIGAASQGATKGPIPEIEFVKRPKSQGYVSAGVYGPPPKVVVNSAAEVKDARQLADFLDNFHDIQTLHVDPIGRTRPGLVSVITDNHANQMARAVDDLMTKYPHVQLREIAITDMQPKYYAMTYPTNVRPDSTVKFGWGSKMEFNKVQLNDDAGFWSKMVEDVTPQDYTDSHTHKLVKKPGWHHVGAENEPAYSVVTHEFGHAVQNSLGSQGLSGQDINKELTKAYAKIVPKPRATAGPRIPKGVVPANDKAREALAKAKEAAARFNAREAKWHEGYLEWLQTTSGYSFGDWSSWAAGAIDRDEIIAESFDAVERLGDTAPEPAKVVHKMLIDRYHKVFDPVDKAKEKRLKEIARQLKGR